MTTLNWATIARTPSTTNEFGQPLMEDYGMDAFVFDARWDVETSDRLDLDIKHILGEDEVVHHTIEAKSTCTVGTQIMALLDDNAPAMLTNSRKPDFIEDGMAWWIGADATVGCDETQVRKLALVAEQGGWLARTGKFPASAGFEVFPHNDTEVLSGPLSKNGEQYALWRMVQDSMLVSEWLVSE